MAEFEPVLLANINKPDSHTLKVYESSGGYAALKKVLADQSPTDVINTVKASGLRGRGGAGFPCGAKWSFLPANHPGPIYMCINADESEPGTFNNRILMEQDPHQVLEGMIIGCYATRASTAYIYVRYEYPNSLKRLQLAIDEAYAAGYLGKNILGKEFSLDIYMHRGAAAYICGEETGLIESLEGKRAWPRIKPPFPAVEGAFRKPTVVNNIETMACVPHIINRGLYTSRGVMAGPAARYAQADDPGRLRGSFHSGFINDHGDKKTDLLGRPVPEERAFAEWQHQQVLAPNLTLNAQLNWWRDSEVLRDFRPRAFFPVQEPDTFVEAVYAGENYFISAFARAQPNRFHRVQERLPEIRFDLLPLAVGHGFYERFSASAAALREDPVGGVGGALRSNRLDAYYSLSRPIAAREWLAITPLVGGRVTHYTSTSGSAIRSASYTRTLGEVGLDAALRTSGTFDYKNPTWKIDGLRHLFTPRLSYRNIPEAQKGRARIPQIDRESFSTYLQPLGLGDVRNIDDLRATNTLRLGLDNLLQTRDPVLGSRDLLLLNVAGDFRFRRAPGVRDVSEIHTELALTPARWLQVDVYQSFAPRTLTLREFNSGITLRDGHAWSLRFGNNFLRNQLQDYTLDGRRRLNERFEAVTRLHYDARKRRFNEQAYGIAQNLGNTWLISYTVSLYSGRRRESSFGFNVQIDTLRF